MEKSITKISEKSPNIWNFHNIFLNDSRSKRKWHRELENILNGKKMKTQHIKIQETQSSVREKYTQ